MPAESKSQQKFFGMVHALQKGEMKSSEASREVKKAAKSMKKGDAEDFASTKHKGLPERKRKRKKSVKLVKESLDEFLMEEYSMELPEFEDAVIQKLQDLGLTWEEADFAIGQIDPEDMNQWKSDYNNGMGTLEDIAEQIYRSAF